MLSEISKVFNNDRHLYSCYIASIPAPTAPGNVPVSSHKTLSPCSLANKICSPLPTVLSDSSCHSLQISNLQFYFELGKSRQADEYSSQTIAPHGFQSHIRIKRNLFHGIRIPKYSEYTP